MRRSMPQWASWAEPRGDGWTVGVEEEVMLLHPSSWSLAQVIDEVLVDLPGEDRAHMCSETHSAAIELNTGVHQTVAGAVGELRDLRRRLTTRLGGMDLRAASAGTHPFAIWHDMRVAAADRHQAVSGSMRALARREPTFALHVHVGVPSPSSGIQAANQLRAHLPVLLALSANSPYWQGRDTGLASARTPLFQAFPRVGIPRVFESYAEWVETVDLLVRSEAFPDHTFLWWDVRVQPKFGTVEVRIMDAQATVEQTAALVALVQCLTRLEVLEGFAPSQLLRAQEVLDENRFLAARDGVSACLIDPATETRIPVAEMLPSLLAACEPHARDLGCEEELALIPVLAGEPGAERQRRLAGEHDDQRHLVASLADMFSPGSRRPARYAKDDSALRVRA